MPKDRRPDGRSPGPTRPEKRDKAADKATAYGKALGLLARREHSRRELGRKLRQGGYEAAEAAEALDRLGAQRYQDDERFAEMLVRSRSAQGYGPLRLRAELKSHGLSDARIRALLEESDVDWAEVAAAQLRRRYGGKPAADPAEKLRRAQFLLRRGFPASTVRGLTHAEVDELADESD
jgi:regulatory protein